MAHHRHRHIVLSVRCNILRGILRGTPPRERCAAFRCRRTPTERLQGVVSADGSGQHSARTHPRAHAQRVYIMADVHPCRHPYHRSDRPVCKPCRHSTHVPRGHLLLDNAVGDTSRRSSRTHTTVGHCLRAAVCHRLVHAALRRIRERELHKVLSAAQENEGDRRKKGEKDKSLLTETNKK